MVWSLVKSRAAWLVPLAAWIAGSLPRAWHAYLHHVALLAELGGGRGAAWVASTIPFGFTLSQLVPLPAFAILAGSQRQRVRLAMAVALFLLSLLNVGWVEPEARRTMGRSTAAPATAQLSEPEPLYWTLPTLLAHAAEGRDAGWREAEPQEVLSLRSQAAFRLAQVGAVFLCLLPVVGSAWARPPWWVALAVGAVQFVGVNGMSRLFLPLASAWGPVLWLVPPSLLSAWLTSAAIRRWQERPRAPAHAGAHDAAGAPSSA